MSSICSAVASPGVPPIGLSETVTMAWPVTRCGTVFWSTQAASPASAGAGALEHDALRRARGERRRQGEVGLDAADLVLGQRQRRVADALPLLLDLARDLLGAGLVDEDLDPRLVLVVAPAELVVDAQDRLRIGQEVLLGQEVADLVADERRPPEAAADIDGEAEPAVGVALEVEADVVDLDRGAVALRAGDRDLELPRQEDELRMERRPLAENLGIGPRVGDLVARGAGEMVGGDVADAVARGLDGVHLDRGEIGEDVRDVLQRRPVELEVLARGEVAVAAVVFAGDEGEHAKLRRVQRPVGDRRSAACRRGAGGRRRSSAGAA